MSVASYKMTEMIALTLIDRREDVIFAILSFPVYISKKNVKSVIGSAVL